MTKSKVQLLNIWFNVWHIPGWLRILEMSQDYDQEDLKELELLDENAMICETEAEDRYWDSTKDYRTKLEEFRKELPADELKEARLSFLNSEIERYNKRLDQIWEHFQELTEQDFPFWLRKTILELNNPKVIESKIRRLSVEKLLLEHPEDVKKLDRVSPEEIARALEFPFKDLIKLNRIGFALCPFHKEKRPSFYVKNNWGYCFGCQWNGNTIKFLMERDNRPFKEVVRFLST